jgi:hypothetical protein
MNILYLVIGSFSLNFLFLLFVMIFGKYSWFQLKAKFMRNPIQVNIINQSNRVLSYLLQANTEKVEVNHKTYHCPRSMGINQKGIQQFFFYEDDAEPIQINENGSINPEYFSQLLIQAEINGANNFLKNLVKLNWIILAMGIMALILLIDTWKVFEIAKGQAVILEFIKNVNLTQQTLRV